MYITFIWQEHGIHCIYKPKEEMPQPDFSLKCCIIKKKHLKIWKFETSLIENVIFVIL